MHENNICFTTTTIGLLHKVISKIISVIVHVISFYDRQDELNAFIDLTRSPKSPSSSDSDIMQHGPISSALNPDAHGSGEEAQRQRGDEELKKEMKNNQRDLELNAF